MMKWIGPNYDEICFDYIAPLVKITAIKQQWTKITITSIQ